MDVKTMRQLRTLHPQFFESQRQQGYRIESPFLKHGCFIFNLCFKKKIVIL